MTTPNPIKIYIRDQSGNYLTGSGDHWSFTSERSLAHVFDYHDDQVPLQLAQAQRDLGVRWIACPLDPNLIVETCDLCGQRIVLADSSFDGTHFLCPACRPK